MRGLHDCLARVSRLEADVSAIPALDARSFRWATHPPSQERQDQTRFVSDTKIAQAGRDDTR